MAKVAVRSTFRRSTIGYPRRGRAREGTNCGLKRSEAEELASSRLHRRSQVPCQSLVSARSWTWHGPTPKPSTWRWASRLPNPGACCRSGPRGRGPAQTRYAPNAEIPELREALVDKVVAQRLRGEPGAGGGHAGGVQALHCTLLALLEPGDEVLLPDPAWPNFHDRAPSVRASALTRWSRRGTSCRASRTSNAWSPRGRGRSSSTARPTRSGRSCPASASRSCSPSPVSTGCGTSPTVRSTTRSPSTTRSSARDRWPNPTTGWCR